MTGRTAPSILIADIGGTNARVGYLRAPWSFDERVPEDSVFTLGSSDFNTFDDFVTAALEQIDAGNRRPVDAVFSVAGPVTDGGVHLTNLDWPPANENDMARAFGFGSCRLVNDLVSAAYGLTGMSSESLADERLQAGDSLPRTRKVLLNVGTGLGVAYWSGEGAALRVDASEAGHVGFAPSTPEDLALLSFLRERYGRVSWERVLAGAGLAELHGFLAGAAAGSSSVVVASAQGGDEAALESIARFSRLLGTYAGDLALGAPAFGGIWLTGGVIDGLGKLLHAGEFIAGLRSKGRMEPLLHAVPVHKIREPWLGLVGAWRIATEHPIL